MLKAVLFDLDNTLVLYDEAHFYEGYFRGISPLFADLLPPERFRERLIRATRSLIENPGDKRNSAYFMDHFLEGMGERSDDLWARFYRFYETGFDRIAPAVTLPERLHAVFAALLKTPLTLVLASNPIFPLSVQLKRLAWTGIDADVFGLVTHIDNMSFCKPSIGYYQQICQKTDTLPEACLMVGNDPVNDMAAARAGLKTYLARDDRDDGSGSLAVSASLRNPRNPEIPAPDFSGPLAGVVSAIERLGGPSIPALREVRS